MDNQNLITIQHANETRSGYDFVGDRSKHGHKSASIFTSALIIFFHNFGRALCKSGRTVRAGRSALESQKYAELEHGVICRGRFSRVLPLPFLVDHPSFSCFKIGTLPGGHINVSKLETYHFCQTYKQFGICL